MFSRPRKLLGELVPFEDHIDDDIVLMKDNAVMAMFSVEGLCPDTADVADVVSWFEGLHNAQKNIAAEDVELFSYACRADVGDDFHQPGMHRDQFASDLDVAYREGLRQATMYANPLFLGVLIHPPNIVVRGLTKLFSDPNVDAQGGIEDRVHRLNELCLLLQAQLSIFGLRRLGYVQRDASAIFDEIAEAVVFATTGIWRPIAATTGRMGNAMFSEAVNFRGTFRRDKRIEFDVPGRSNCAAMFAFREYPRSTWPGMFQSLMTAPYRCTIAQSFRFLSNAAGESALGRKQNKMLIAGDKAQSQTSELSQASDDLLSRKWVLGDHSLVLIAFADSRNALANVSHAAWRDLAACGLVATRMGGTLRAAWISTLPGAAAYRPRPGFVSSRNWVAFAPFYSWPQGKETGHWPGPPIAIFRTLAGTPYRFHWHVGDVGNTLFTGATGSGKTTLVGMLLAMSAGRARIAGLDHKRGWQFLTHNMGGDYAVLGAGEPHLAPLKALTATRQNIEFLIDLYRGCIGSEMTEEQGRRLALGISTIMDLPPEKRSVSELRAFFSDEPEGAGTRLEKWCWPRGELGWVLDAPKETVNFGRFSVHDTTALLDNSRARGPALAYLFHRISLMLDGTPTLIPCDEGWRALIDPFFRLIIERLLRTIRSKNGAVAFITQSPRDIIDSGIANILVEQCQTQFHLANPRGTRADYVDGLKLSDGQYEAFRGLQSGQGLFLLIQGAKSVVAQLPMRGLDKELRILSASEEDLTGGGWGSLEDLKEAAE